MKRGNYDHQITVAGAAPKGIVVVPGRPPTRPVVTGAPAKPVVTGAGKVVMVGAAYVMEPPNAGAPSTVGAAATGAPSAGAAMVMEPPKAGAVANGAPTV